MPMRRCPVCHKTIPEGSWTCPHCGSVLPGFSGGGQDPWEQKRERDPWEHGRGFHDLESPPEGCGCPKNAAEKRKMKEQSRTAQPHRSLQGFHSSPERFVSVASLVFFILILVTLYLSLRQ